jgi:hypothetical protein
VLASSTSGALVFCSSNKFLPKVGHTFLLHELMLRISTSVSIGNTCFNKDFIFENFKRLAALAVDFAI